MAKLDLAAFRKNYKLTGMTEAVKEAEKQLARWRDRDVAPFNQVCWVIFTELLRTGTPITPELERLLPVPQHVDHLPEAKACLDAIPEERRMPALVASLHRVDATQTVHGGLAWLAMFPDAELVPLILARSKDSEIMPPGKARAGLEALAATNPALAAALAAAPAPRVVVGAIIKPASAAELTRTAREQLQAAAKAYDKKDVPIERRFGPDDGSETSFGSTIEISTFTVNDRAFDIVQFAGDSGSVFEAGTTREVASIVQGGIECEDDELAEGLSSVLAR